jgi:flagellar biosynthesis protein FlhB
MIAAFVAPLFLGGWLFSTQAFEPKFSRLNPLQGLGRLFSSQSLAELGKTIAKSLLIGSVAAAVLWRALPQLLDLLREPAAVAMPAALAVVGWTCVLVTASLLLVALIDVPWQLWSHHKKLRMTLEEVKKEHKETEGDPYIKAQIRRQRQQMARRRMMSEVPKADVVITNPTHYAVALRYEEGGTGAPRVVAKGMDLVAERIKALAAEHRIPLLEAPPLARALHQHTALGEEIPGALYTAVAEVLAWAMQLKRAAHGERPPRPTDLPVPPDMDPLHKTAGAPA